MYDLSFDGISCPNVSSKAEESVVTTAASSVPRVVLTHCSDSERVLNEKSIRFPACTRHICHQKPVRGYSHSICLARIEKSVQPLSALSEISCFASNPAELKAVVGFDPPQQGG